MVHRSINLVKQSTGLVASLGLISIHLDQMPNDEARAQVREGMCLWRIVARHFRLKCESVTCCTLLVLVSLNLQHSDH